MNELDRALARLEAAVERLEDRAPPSPPAADEDRLRGLAEALAARVDAALARLDLLLAPEG